MIYYSRPRLKAYVILPLIASAIIWFLSAPLVRYIFSLWQKVPDYFLLYHAIVCYVAALLIFVYYLLRSRYEIVLDKGALVRKYDKRSKVPDENIAVEDIQVLEIITLDFEDDYDVCRIYSKGHEVVEFVRYVVPKEDVLAFCRENGIVPVMITMSLHVSDVKLRKDHLQFYYTKEKNDVKIRYRDIKQIELIIPDPISYTLNRYLVSTVTGEEYEFEEDGVEKMMLDACAQGHGFPIIERRLYEEEKPKV